MNGRIDSPHPLIFASRVNGTPVLNAEGDRIGHIEDLAIGKLDGEVAYAILSVGGFLGMGERYHPLPWATLEYDTERNSYVLPLSRDDMRGAPSFTKEELAGFDTSGAPMLGQVSRYYDGRSPGHGAAGRRETPPPMI